MKASRYRNVKHLLILLMRVISVAALVFIFSQPFIPALQKKNVEAHEVGILLDDSPSMQATGTYGSLIDQASSQVREMIKLARKKGLEAGTFIMLGYPGETQSDIKETIRHLNDSAPDYFTITLAYPIKGTPLYAETENKFIDQQDWEISTDRDIDFKRTYSRRYYDFALRWVHNEVAFNKNLKKGALLKLPVFKLKSIAAQGGMFLQRILK